MRIFGDMDRIAAFARDVFEASALRARVEQMDVQLAGVSVAALGGTDPETTAKRGQWGWSVAYQDVLDLRRQHDEFRELLVEIAKAWSRCDCAVNLVSVHSPEYKGKPCIHERAHLLMIKPRRTD